jgi:hypothetical protein
MAEGIYNITLAVYLSPSSSYYPSHNTSQEVSRCGFIIYFYLFIEILLLRLSSNGMVQFVGL